MENKYTGLIESEIINNQKLYGKNVITLKNNNNKIKFILEMLKNPIFILSIIGLITYLVLSEFVYAIIMGTICIIILTTHIFQQLRLNKITKSLNKIRQDKCKVIRDNKEVIINSDELTIDDIIILKEGDKINADAIILASSDLYVDESNIIKTHVNVPKSLDLLDKNAKLKSNYVYRETFVIKGSGVAKVINIGNKTEYSKNCDMNLDDDNNSNLKKRINKLYKILTIVSIILLIGVVTTFTITNNIITGIIYGITIAVATIPIMTTLSFKLIVYSNIYKTFKNNALIKKNMEKISKTTCLCIDKIGLITSNKMQVKEFYSTIDDKDAVINCVLASNKNSNDPIDQAIFDYANKNNIEIDKEYKIIKKYSYNSKTKLMANIYEYNNELYLFVKGSLNSIFDICDLDVEEKYKLHNFKKQLYKRGLHVMAFASKKIEKIEKDILKYEIDFNGILGLNNVPKNNVKDSVEECKKCGIKVILMTKDNIQISSSIGKQIGIDNYKNVLTGKEIDDMSDDELITKIKNVRIFSKISEKQKLRLIKLLKINNEIVATTSNSVQELELLKATDIGITMFGIGTNINKQFTDLIIFDDNLKTIVNTIKDSRTIIKFINRLIKYIIIISIILSLFSIILMLFNYQTLFIPILIIILKIILEIICYLVLNNKYCKPNI